MSALGTILSRYDSAVAGLRFLAWLPPVAARISVGWVFMESGWGKLHHLDQVTGYFRSLGIPAPELQAPFAATSELVFGTTLLLGLVTRVSTIPLTIIMLVAIATAKREDIGSASDLFAMEEYLFIALFLWLLVHGGGALSLDRLLVALRPKAGPETAPTH